MNSGVSLSDSYPLSEEYHKAAYLLLWVLIIAITAWNSEGWLQPDEHARVLEPAHFIAYGYASLPWELTVEAPMVSWLLGVMVSPLLMVTKYFHMDGLSEAALARFIVGMIASSRFIALWDIMRRLSLKSSRRFFYLMVMMVGVYGPLFLVRTSQETFAGTALIWAFYWALRIEYDGFTNARAFGFAVLLAFVASARPQVGIAAACLGFWMLWRQGPKIILPAVLALLIGLLPLAIVDYQATGMPFRPAINYYHYALGDENGGRVWGTSPWWYYIQQYFEAWYPPLSPLLLIPLAAGLMAVPSLATVVVPFTIAHFVLGHKETRYFSPMIPFLQLCMFKGIEIWEMRSPLVARVTSAAKFWRRTLKFVACLTLVAGLLPLNSSPWMYEEIGRHVRAGTIVNFTYIGNTMTGFSQFYAKVPTVPAYKQLSWNDVEQGRETPSGWLAFYALDPEDFRIIEKKCGTEGYHRFPDWYIDALALMPRSPARRRVNPIVYCSKPLRFNSAN